MKTAPADLDPRGLFIFSGATSHCASRSIRSANHPGIPAQAVIFTLTKTDGTQLRVQEYNPFIVIDERRGD